MRRFMYLFLLLFCYVGFIASFQHVRADVDFDLGSQESTTIPRSKQFVPKSTIVTYPVVFAPEQRTFDNTPNLEEILRQETIPFINNFYDKEGIPIQFEFLRLDPPFDINVETTCPAYYQQWYPSLYCDHPFSYIYVVLDNNSSNKPSASYLKASVRMNRNGGLFSTDSTIRRIFVHEFSHITGLPDLYSPRIFPEDNAVNGTSYYPFIGDVMYNQVYDTFSDWSTEVLLRQQPFLPSDWTMPVVDQPAQNYIQVLGSNNCPVTNAQINIYDAKIQWYNYTLDATADTTGITDGSGTFFWGNNILGTEYTVGLKIFLIEVSKSGATDYSWMDFSDINFAYWEGQTNVATHVIHSNFVGNCSGSTPTPSISTPTPTPTKTPTPLPSATPTGQITPSPGFTISPTSPPVVCPRKSEGDANCDDRITLLDFDRWRQEFLKILSTQTADFDSSQSVSLVDFEIWRSHRE